MTKEFGDLARMVSAFLEQYENDADELAKEISLSIKQRTKFPVDSIEGDLYTVTTNCINVTFQFDGDDWYMIRHKNPIVQLKHMIG